MKTRPLTEDQEEWVFRGPVNAIDAFVNERLEKLRPKLFAIACRKYPQDRRAAYELADDALRRVWDARKVFARSCQEKGGGNLLSYTVRIVYTSFVDDRRAAGRVMAPPEPADVVDHTPMADEQLTAREDVEQQQRSIGMMRDCLARLPQAQRMYVEARFFEFDGQPQARVADRYEVTRANVSEMLRRGLAALRECMKEKMRMANEGESAPARVQP